MVNSSYKELAKIAELTAKGVRYFLLGTGYDSNVFLIVYTEGTRYTKWVAGGSNSPQAGEEWVFLVGCF